MDNSCENEAGKSLLSEPTTSSTSFHESSINYHNSNEVDDLYRNDLRPTCLDSGDVTVEEGYTSPDTASVGGVGSPARRPSTGQAHNIPYMQLFHHLKQQFPDLKDCDINESIQKFGLDRGRCEAELQQRAVAHTSGYYGPWGRTTGNWSTRSSPAPTPTRSDTPFTAHTTPSTPVMSPITSPFASQVPIPSHPSQNSRSAPVLVGPPTLVGPPLDVNICPVSLAQTNCVVTTANSQYALLVSSSSSSPTGMTPSSARAGNRHMSSSAGVTSSCSGHPHLVSTPSETIHTATTQHYVASHPITPSLNDIVYRQHSTSTDTTLTEEESMGGSNLTSPTSTLPLSPSPQPQGCSHSPNFSLESREQLQYAGPPVQFCAPPLQHLPPNSRAAHPSQYHQPHAPLVYPTSPHLYGWNPPVNSVPQNYTIGDRPVNESNHIADYPNSIHLENYLVGPGRIPGALNSYSSGIPLARQEFIPNITSSPASYTTNSSRRSRSTTPGVVLSPPTSAPVVSSSYEPFGGSYLYQHGEARRRRSEHVPLEPVRVAPPPPSAPSARETNYFPGDSSLNDKLSNLHINPSLLGGSPTVPALTTTSAATPRTHPAVPSSRPSGGLDRVASSSGVGHSSGVPSTAAGAKHVASLHFVPTPPHSAHLIACPPPNKGSLELSDRSYTSVNLRLRQPSSDPQPAIDIKSSGSCLTYSTSSLDRRQGSRSSLQISIGPAGGSISAMRTNLSTELNRGNAALHIQYRAGDDSDDHPNGGGGDDDECPAGVAEAAFPTTRDVHHFPPKPMYRSSSGGAGQRSNGGVPYRVRPQSWYVSPTWQEQRTDTADLMTSSVGLSNTNSLLHPSRRNSMPDSVRLAEAYAEEEQRRRQQQESVVLGEEGACPIDSEVPWSAGEALYVQGLVAEQRTRHQRLLAVLQEGRAEFQSLKQEVNRLESTLALRRQQGDRAGAANAQRIEAIQEENRRLQSECDQMEGDILQTGEEPEVLDEEYCPLPSIPGARETGVGNLASQLPFSPAHSRLPPNRTPPSGSVRPEVPRRLTPTRTAPPPPLVGATAHNIPNFVSYEQDEGRGPGDGSGDDAGEGRWSCNRCTYDNHPAMSSCEICGAIRMPGSSPLQQPPPRSGGGGGGNSSSSTAGHQQNQQAPLGRNTTNSVYAATAGVGLWNTVETEQLLRSSRDASFDQTDGGLWTAGAAAESSTQNVLGVDGGCVAGEEMISVPVKSVVSVSSDENSKDCFCKASLPVEIDDAVSSSTDDEGNAAKRDSTTFFRDNTHGSVRRSDPFAVISTELNVTDSRSDAVDGPKSIRIRQHSQKQESFVDEICGAGVVTETLVTDVAVRRKEGKSSKMCAETVSDSSIVPRGSHDDLETFRFFSGLSLGSQSSRPSIEPSSATVCGSAASPHTDCYCHPQQRRLRVVPGHRRTGSGGTFSFLDRPDRDSSMATRRYSGDVTAADIRDRGGLMDVPLGQREGSSGYSSGHSNLCELVGSEAGQASNCSRSEVGGVGSSSSDISKASEGCEAFGSGTSTKSGGSRSFGYDTSPLLGHPEDLG